MNGRIVAWLALFAVALGFVVLIVILMRGSVPDVSEVPAGSRQRQD